MLDRIASWIHASGFTSYRLVCRGDMVDEVTVDTVPSEDEALDIVHSWDALAQAHCESTGRAGMHVFTIVGEKDGLTETCRIRITKSAETLQLGKIVTELHKVLVKDRRQEFQGLRDYVHELVKENRLMRKTVNEHFTLLERARSQELERKIALEQHEKEQHLKDRVINAGLPAILAIANTVVGKNLLPAPDIRATSLTEIAKSLDEKTIEKLAEITEEGETLVTKLEDADKGTPDINYFMGVFRRMNMQQAQAIFGVLNPGQQANLQSLLAMGVHDNGSN